jgi:hypothetical protein
MKHCLRPVPRFRQLARITIRRSFRAVITELLEQSRAKKRLAIRWHLIGACELI